MIYTTDQFKVVGKLLSQGKIGVIPTDTIYGVAGSAFIPGTVKKIYKVKKRSENKPFIILISSLNELKKFSVNLSDGTIKILKNIWPNPVSVIFECQNSNLKYLHRGTNSLAFRVPKNELVQKILKISGPLVAPSANPEGLDPATNIIEAEKYFEDKIDFHLDNGTLKNNPSTLISISNDGQIKILRQGKYKLEIRN